MAAPPTTPPSQFDRQVYGIEIGFAETRRRPRQDIQVHGLTAGKQSLAIPVAAVV